MLSAAASRAVPVICFCRFLCFRSHVLDGGHNAHRAAEIVDPRIAGHQLTQAEPHQLYEVHGLIPCVLETVWNRSRHRQIAHIQAEALIRLPLLIGAGLPGNVLHHNAAAIPDHLDIRTVAGIP